jgi:dTMP kinase
MANKLIILDGPDGVGKSIVIEAVCNALNVEVTQEPYNNPIRDLATSRHADVTTQTLLYCADRRLHMAEIREWLVEQDVICDRGPLSTVVYQGLVGGVDLDWIEQLNDTAMEGITVAATIVLYAPLDVICERIEKRDDWPVTGDELDRLKQVWEAYEAIRRNPNKRAYHWSGGLSGTMHFIDANRPAEVVEADVIELVNRIIKGEA